jgi:hypothetical protein
MAGKVIDIVLRYCSKFLVSSIVPKIGGHVLMV